MAIINTPEYGDICSGLFGPNTQNRSDMAWNMIMLKRKPYYITIWYMTESFVYQQVLYAHSAN